jgi:hypothetical protein
MLADVSSIHASFLYKSKGDSMKLVQIAGSKFFALCLLLVVQTASADSGFADRFAPANWQIVSYPAGSNLVDTSAAPASIKLSNDSNAQVSGATFTFASAPENGVVSFSYALAGTTQECRASYAFGSNVFILTERRTQATFNVVKGQSFGFALNGQNLPDNSGCKSGGASVSMVVSKFTFTPSP